jgi:hypothetical protein
VPRSSFRHPLLGSAFALLLLFSACGGDDSGDSPAMGDSSDQATDDTTSDDSDNGTVEVPEDICALVTADEVGAVLGETVEAKDVPGGGCQYAGGTSASLYPTISIAEDVAGAGGIEGAQSGAEMTLNTTGEAITVGGFDGYVVSGSLGSSTSTQTQGAVSANGLIVTITMSGGDAAANAPIVTQLLELTLAAIDA